MNRSIWLRLAKMDKAGAALSETGKTRFDTLSKQYRWQLAEDESDEFSFWMGNSRDNDRDQQNSFTPVPRTMSGVRDYLLAHPVLTDSQRDNWRERCSEMFQETASALCALRKQGNWPIDRWRDALQAWGEENLRIRSWHYMALVVVDAPDNLVKALSRDISWWLQAVAKTFENHENLFLKLIQRILQLNIGDNGDANDPVFHAIDHPISHVTQALLDWWHRQEPNDEEGLPDSVKPIFTQLCNTRIARFRHGRILLAAHTLSLFRVDKAWSKQYLLPLLDWSRPEVEVQAIWKGFLRSPRLHLPLMEAIKPSFLDTVNHYAQLGKHGKQFAALLTFTALDPADTFTITQLATAIRALPPDGLHESLQTLVRALEGAGDQREDYWKNRVLPFWKNIWPKSNDQASNANADSLARLCIAARNEFPSAMTEIKSWLDVIEYPNYVILRLQEFDLPTHFPEKALQLLFTILGERTLWLPQELRQCLDAIGQALPKLRQDYKFMRVDELARQFNI